MLYLLAQQWLILHDEIKTLSISKKKNQKYYHFKASVSQLVFSHEVNVFASFSIDF